MAVRALYIFPGTTHPVSMGSQVRANQLLVHLCDELQWQVDVFTPYGLLRSERWGDNMQRLHAIYIPKAVGPPRPVPVFQIPNVRKVLSGGLIEAVVRDVRGIFSRFRGRRQPAKPQKGYEILSYINKKSSHSASVSPVSARMAAHDKPHYRDSLQELLRNFDYDVIIVTYVWMSKMVDWLLEGERKAKLVCDTIDVQYLREARLQSYRKGGALDLETEKQLELEWLSRYDLIVGITDIDRDQLATALPGKAICTVPIRVSVPEEALLTPESWAERVEQKHCYDLVFLGGKNEGNIYAVTHLLEDLLPKLVERRPDLTLGIAGSICDIPMVKEYAVHPAVSVCGYVPSVTKFYEQARVLAAPIPAGGGVKVKILDGMAHGVPVVTTPVGIEGIPFEDGVQGYVVESDEDFVERADALLRDPALLQNMAFATQRGILEKLGSNHVYNAFDQFVDANHA